MSRFCSLFSGSSGNSAYIGNSGGGILIDAGTNAKRLTAALNSISVSPDRIHGIFITHEHSDHIGALRVFASRNHIPVFAKAGTLEALEKQGHLRGIEKVYVIGGKPISLADMEILSCQTSHDSAESCGYIVNMPDERKISVITDTGYITADAEEKAAGSDLIMLESNHDTEMLKHGGYPYYLKQRILSQKGHLSNDDCAAAACRFINSGTTRLILAHLSRENNTPKTAYDATNTALGAMGALAGQDYILQVASPEPTERPVTF